jgi:ATP phosphoribosyltransferase regulatory subunit
VDFSVVNDMVYYNGIVFRGFVEGVPGGVLSGGQYDALMQKMNRRGKAIGFAIYPDLLERLQQQQTKETTDAVLLYDDTSNLTALCAAVEELIARGMTVKVLPAGTLLTENVTVYRLEGNEVKGNA